MIRITIRHKRADIAEHAARLMAKKLKSVIGNRVIGPSTPGISRLRGFYIQDITIKMEKKKDVILSIKKLVQTTKKELTSMEGSKSVRFTINVDP